MRRYIAVAIEPPPRGFAVKDRWTGRLVLAGPFDAEEAHRLADTKELLGDEPVDIHDGGAAT